MKIIDQNLNMSAQHSASQQLYQHISREHFINGQLAERNESQQLSEQVSLSKQQAIEKLENRPPQWLWLKDKQAGWLTNLTKRATQNHTDLVIHHDNTQSEQIIQHNRANHATDENAVNKPQLPPQLIKMIEAVEAMMERFTGKPFKLTVYGYERADNAPQPNQKTWIGSNEFHGQFRQMAKTFGQTFHANGQREMASTQGQRLQFQQTYQEQETSRFQASGKVSTADGRQIEFNMDMLMQRQFTSQQSLTFEQGVVFKDPLVVNFGGEPAQLTVDEFDFDIDADDKPDRVSFVTGQSGFLALDKNRDGQINNGSELFGAITGNGFEELSVYDDDNNGWIDENDAIFSQLQIWHQTEQGYKQLSGLLELNIGAIALQHITTPFDLKDDNNQQHGRVTDSGIYLNEDGQAGSVQQIDLVI